MNIQKLHEWIVNHHTGISSRTMWTGLMDVEPAPQSPIISFDVPYDVDDFSRCYDLVKFCEVDPDKDFPKILARFPFYAPIVRNWNKLITLYEAKDYSGVYNLLDSLMPEVRFLKTHTSR